jgi:hypothetical protein
MFKMTNENFARLLDGLTIAVGNRKNRILFYQFLAAEIRALHYSYGVGDSESYKRALTFLEKCERLTLRRLMRNSAERHVEVTVDLAKRIFFARLRNTRCPTCTDTIWRKIGWGAAIRPLLEAKRTCTRGAAFGRLGRG